MPKCFDLWGGPGKAHTPQNMDLVGEFFFFGGGGVELSLGGGGTALGQMQCCAAAAFITRQPYNWSPASAPR